jgi:predicted nuclease of predicted toxin-antitoxin system
MNPLDFALLTDENIAPEVVAALRDRRIDICTLHDLGLSGATDTDILSRAHSANRVVLTHDADFGFLAVRRKVPFIGVIFLRPGHIKTSFSLEALDTLRSAAVDVDPPFLIVLERKQNRILIRLRHEP